MKQPQTAIVYVSKCMAELTFARIYVATPNFQSLQFAIIYVGIIYVLKVALSHSKKMSFYLVQ